MTVASTVVERISLIGTVMISLDRIVKSAILPGSREPKDSSVKEAQAGSMVIPTENGLNECLFFSKRRVFSYLSEPLDVSNVAPGTLDHFVRMYIRHIGGMIYLPSIRTMRGLAVGRKTRDSSIKS